ncbi:transmembrane and coiled-coil domain-containing protein 4-like [Neocloeon triangulifer]|uniref:transmembrane and coiled-coil domain-containing protein 4-like n=1 Tax=Neocloeon triangulifer TaxID=2078957 RepID=UPI00286F1D97|nr:transmembrane and coiled-coil domain-containing protein 4-like [Neocloeon triangulifer]XP_059481338.1 transmembrane and coiled-coil domain-containing protein 4-like [Neocloeon triangulifer]
MNDLAKKLPESALKEKLSDAATYCYAAICALSLHELFGNKWDLPYSIDCIKKFTSHLGLPLQVNDAMKSLVEGQGSQTYQAYVELLLAEPQIQANPVIIIQDMVLFGIKSGHYDARTRVLIAHVAVLMGAPAALAQLAEEALGQSLLSSHSEQSDALSPEQQQVADRRQRTRKIKRYALIGLATVGGGALIGLTGGLAAPLIGAGIGTIVGGGAAAAAIGSVAGAAVLGSLFGLAGAGLTGYRMKRRVGDIEEFEFGKLSVGSGGQLHIAIAVSGWLTEEDDEKFKRPWKCLDSSKEQYFLRYESSYLKELGQALDMAVSAAVTVATQEVLKFTILRGILTAIAWPASLVSLSSIIDNPWGVCLRRSAQVGRHLAHVLLAREHGGRPVTLVGYSLGARVVFYCLRELADRRPGSEGIVQEAIMLGAPVTGSVKDWQDISTVVAGRIVNGYCRSDWLLKFLYRTTSIAVNIAGLNEISCDSKRLQNVDLTDIVSGHTDYESKVETLLKVVGVRTIDCSNENSLRKSQSEWAIGSASTDPTCSIRQSMSDSALVSNASDEQFEVIAEDNVAGNI